MQFFPTIDEVEEMLESIIEDIPSDFFYQLTGGIILEDELKYHKESVRERPLYVLGEYRNLNIGRSIVIYYGSFKESFPYESHSIIYDKLRYALIHEFTHHLESLSGTEDLRLEDRQVLEKYKKDYK